MNFINSCREKLLLEMNGEVPDVKPLPSPSSETTIIFVEIHHHDYTTPKIPAAKNLLFKKNEDEQ